MLSSPFYNGSPQQGGCLCEFGGNCLHLPSLAPCLLLWLFPVEPGNMRDRLGAGGKKNGSLLLLVPAYKGPI